MDNRIRNPKVSIIIPVYNGRDYLSEAIESALAQTYENIEILVINDGSNDDGETERLAISYGEKIRYCSKPNGGVASALNMGISKMSGDYFSWLSHDDLYTKDKIEKNITALAKIDGDNTIIYSDYSVFTTNSDEDVSVHLKGVSPEQFRYWITVENKLHGCTLLIPRHVFEKIGNFNESLRTTQDYDLWFRMAKEFNFVHIPDILVKARSHADQGSHKMAGIALKECNDLLSNFIINLDAQEIISVTNKPLGNSYADIASSMFNRGFNEAGQLAEQYAKENTMQGNKTMELRRNAIYLKDRLVNKAKKIIPLKQKNRIKKILGILFNKEPSVRKIEHNELKEKFSEVYEKNIFGGRVSRSGEGSDFIQTEVIRRELPKIVNDFSIKTFLDAPCGDWYWMKETNLGVEQYIGVDIVEAMIEQHQKNYSSSTQSFQCLNLATDSLPKVDLIFSRDCLVHLSFDDALKIISNFKKSGSKYLLTTTFVDRTTNNDLVGEDSFWRPLNMCLTPFNFPKPLLLVNENCTEEASQFTDKNLGLWLLSEINL